jgi:hypothetical protein
MVTNKTLKNDNNLTVINVSGKFGDYSVYIQLGRVTVIPIDNQKTGVYVNSQAEEIKGIVVGDH